MARNLVFEIGVEELPSSPLYGAIEQLQVSAPKALDAARLEYDTITVTGSPRRLVVSVTGLSEAQDDAVHTAKGPSVKAAFPRTARRRRPLKASRAARVSRSSRSPWSTTERLLRLRDGRGEGRGGRRSAAGLLAKLTEGIEWPKSQRWGSGEARFSRPVAGCWRSLAAMS